GGLLALPIFWRRRAKARAVRPAALIRAAKGRGRRPRRRDELGYGQLGGEDFRLQGRDVSVPDQRMIHRRDRVLPSQLLLRDEGAQITRDRPHVAVRQLEPCPGERV